MKKPNKNDDILTTVQLCALTNLTDRRHRQLATDGFFPPPIRGEYQREATLRGIFKYYREAMANRKMPADEPYNLARTRKEVAMASQEERRDRHEAKELIEAEAVATVWEGYLVHVRQTIRRSDLSESKKREILDQLKAIPAGEFFKDNKATEAE